MHLINTPDLVKDLENGYLFFDTNILVAVVEYPDMFGDFLGDLSQQGCSFLTVPQVQFEFTRGSGTVERYNERIKFLDDFKFSKYPVDKHADEFPELVLMLHKVSRGISYTDYLLCLCMCKFTTSYLISEDRDIPTALFDRKHIITLDTEKDIRSFGVYQLSESKMKAISKTIS